LQKHLCNLLTYGQQICIVCATDMVAPTDPITPSLTFSRSRVKCENQIFGQMGEHKLSVTAAHRDL